MSLGLPQLITGKLLMARTEHNQVTASRLLAAFRFFAFIDDGGVPTKLLEDMAKLDDQDFGNALGEMIQELYKDIFDRADPSASTKEQIEQAFRPYTPASQHYRMMVFFLGLCRHTGVLVLAPPRTRRLVPENRYGRGSGNRSSVAEALAPSQLIIKGMIDWLPKEGTPVSTEVKDRWAKAMRNFLDVIYPEEG